MEEKKKIEKVTIKRTDFDSLVFAYVFGNYCQKQISLMIDDLKSRGAPKDIIEKGLNFYNAIFFKYTQPYYTWKVPVNEKGGIIENE